MRKGTRAPAEIPLLDRRQLLTLTAPEMTVLLSGMRALKATFGQSARGVLTMAPGTLTNDYFVNLTNMNIEWRPSSTEGAYDRRDRKTGEIKCTATWVALEFG